MADDTPKGRARDRQPESGDPDPAPSSADAVPEAMREAGRRAMELAQNPMARSLLAAGLMTAAAAIASNKSVRETARRNLKATTELAEATADNVNRVGAAMINAAADAVQQMLNMGAAAAPAGAPVAAGMSETDPSTQPATAATTPPESATASQGQAGRAEEPPAVASVPESQRRTKSGSKATTEDRPKAVNTSRSKVAGSTTTPRAAAKRRKAD